MIEQKLYVVLIISLSVAYKIVTSGRSHFNITILLVKTKLEHPSKDLWCICKRKHNSIAKVRVL